MCRFSLSCPLALKKSPVSESSKYLVNAILPPPVPFEIIVTSLLPSSIFARGAEFMFEAIQGTFWARKCTKF